MTQVKELRPPVEPKGYNWALGPWRRVLHLTQGGTTACGQPVSDVLTNNEAIRSHKNICHACMPIQRKK